MVAIPLPVSTFPGARPQEGAGRLINCRAEPLGENARASAVRHRVPGLRSFGTSALTGFRGALLNGSTLYTVIGAKLVSFTSAGGAGTVIDDLAGTDRVSMAKNNKRPTADMVAVCQAGTFVLTSSTVTDLGDADLPSATDVCFLDGYFFFGIADGRCFASGLNATTVGANDFITAEAKSDTLYRVISWNGQLFIWSAGSAEVWSGSPVNATGFPFNRSAVIQRGLIAKTAIAGFEDGFGKGLLFVGDDNAVHQLNGYTPEKVSPPDLDRLIEAVSDKTTLEAGVYISGGHPIWVLSCAAWTWEFDLNTQKWDERNSYLDVRWRGTQPFTAFGKWLCGDTDSGNVLQITRDVHTEAGNPLIAEVWSAPVHKFPNRVRCARVDFDFSPGVGLATGTDPNETDPSVEISYSDDGGYSFTNPRIRKLGKQGKPLTRVTLFNNGTTGAQGRIWKIRMSDPRHFGLMAADMSAELKVG
jgi:hypothetical protein